LFISQILEGLKHINKPQIKFLAVLFQTILVCPAKINFSTLGRNSTLNERTYRRQFRREFDFVELNQEIIKQSACQIKAFAMDAGFIKKSGKETFGLDKFWNGCGGRAEKGLEASIISLICEKQNASFALTVDQTEPNLVEKEGLGKQTRIDFYAAQVEKVAPQILAYTRVGLFDGYYAKEKFVRKMSQLGLTVISRLRADANLKHLYTGEQKPKGRPRTYEGKVDFTDLSRLAETTVKVEEKEIKLLSGVVFSVSLKRKIKLVVVQYGSKTVNLFATDLLMSASEIFFSYRSRFTIEFLIRDAKQSGGLNDCQARSNQAIEFHWNTALTSVNLARAMSQREQVASAKKPFSMKSIKQQFFNENLLKLFISKLGLEQSFIKYEEILTELRNYATIFS
jgi:hypothetical protein